MDDCGKGPTKVILPAPSPLELELVPPDKPPEESASPAVDADVGGAGKDDVKEEDGDDDDDDVDGKKKRLRQWLEAISKQPAPPEGSYQAKLVARMGAL